MHGKKISQNRTNDAAAGQIRIAMISLGCPKNLVDSEKMLAGLAEHGCAITPDAADADVVVVNTCGFLQAAKNESLDILAELKLLKDKDPHKRIVVAGCLVQREEGALLQQVPYIDAIVGVHGRQNLVEAVLEVTGRAAGQAKVDLPAYDPSAVWSDRGRLRLTPRHYAYVRISEGCDQNCTFCTIPSIRGPFRSKKPEEVLAEARELVDDGTGELILIGQDTTGYGLDIGYEPGLGGLLRELNELPGVTWIRVMYTYPRQFSDSIIQAMAECERVAKYVDMPLQHINDQVLRRMGRRVDRATVEGLLERLRAAVPGMAIRTTFIVGFPGETESQFEELLAFVQQQRFDAVGVFAYSREPGTPAAELPEQVDEAVKQQRLERLMLAQQVIALEAARRRKGKTLEVVVDRPAESANLYEARHSQQAPEVDSVTLVKSSRPLRPGDVLRVRCTGSKDYDLLAEPVRPDKHKKR